MNTDKRTNNEDPYILIKDLWKIIATGADSVVELRAIHPKGHALKPRIKIKHFRASEFSSIDEFRETVEHWAIQENDIGYNIYIVMNPIVPNFSGETVSDKDVAYRDLLLIDIDRARTGNEPANEEEIQQAFALAKKIEYFLGDPEIDPPVRVMSGNGVHLYYFIVGCPNDENATRQIHKLLLTLAHHFDTDKLKVDTTVFNASRITKVPGTLMRKGQENPEEGRVFRRAYVCTNT